MHENRKRQYIDRLASVVGGATTRLEDGVLVPRPRTDGSKSYALNDEIHGKRTSIVSDLLKKDGWSKRFSQKYVEDRIAKIVSENVGTPDNSGIEPMFTKLVDEFNDFKSKNTVLIPLEGIVLKIPELSFGKIRLVTVTAEYLNNLRARADRISKEAKGSKEAKDYQMQELNETIEQFQGTVCAERVIVAESIRAREIARDELRLVVGILNFLADAIVPNFYRARVGLKGEFSRGQRIELASQDDLISWEYTITGPRAPLEINDEALKVISQLKIHELADLATSDEFDAEKSFEGTILTAIHFHSHARELPDLADKVLSVITAIESFFETSQKSIASTIANGCALVLCNELEDRIKMKKLIKKLYKLRSSISHSGERTVLDSDFAELSFVSWQLICYAIESRDRFKSKSDFNLWVEKLELGLKNELSIITFKK